MSKSKYVLSILLVLLIMTPGCLKLETRMVDLPNRLVESSNQPPSIAATFDRSFAVDGQGDLWMWGRVSNNENAPYQLNPIKTNVISEIQTISAISAYTLAVKQDGTVSGWGYNTDGVLGDGTRVGRLKPVPVKGLVDIQKVDTDMYSPIALKQDGTVWVWGDNMSRQLGMERESGEIPIQVPELKGIIDIASSGLSNLALQADGTIWAWGYGNHIDLNVEDEWQEVPSRVIGISDVIDISASGLSLLALKKDGTVWEWGSGGPPAQIQELNNITAIEQGLHTAYAIHEDGTLWTWESGTKPEQVSGISNVIQISAGDDYAIAVDADGNLWSWGDNTYGQLGDGTTVSRDTPVKISLEESTPIENDYTDHDMFTVKYDNTEINFSIEIPPSWKGKYLVKQEGESVVIYHNTTLENPASIMDIATTSSEMWSEHPPGEYPWDKLGEKDDIVIVYHQLAEQAYPLENRDEEDEVMNMLNDIKQVKINIID